MIWGVWVSHSQLHAPRLLADGGGECPTRAQVCAHVSFSLAAGDAAVCLCWEEPKVRWIHDRTRWPLFCLRKRGVNLLLSSTSHAKRCTVWFMNVASLVLSVRPTAATNKASLTQVPFCPCFASRKPLLLQHTPTPVFPGPRLGSAGRSGWSLRAFVPSKDFFFPNKTQEMLWLVEIEQIFPFSPLCE